MLIPKAMARESDDILGDWQIFFFLGIAGLFFGGFFLLIGLILLVIGSGIELMFLGVFAPIALIPGTIFAWIGKKNAEL